MRYRMEPFKEFINAGVVKTVSRLLSAHVKAFPADEFEQKILPDLPKLELKQRIVALTNAADELLTDDFESFCDIMLAILHPSEDATRDNVELSDEGLCGFPVWAFTELTTIRALRAEKPDAGMAILKEQTKRSTAEFAVRPLIDRHPDIVFPILMEWTQDPNRHVRRLASEGSRPRLPWGMQLKALIKNPDPVIPILDAMKDDPEDYVRRSVANNLNDIAKDHPARVFQIAEKWLKNSDKNRERLVKHACRTLFKDRNLDVLKAFGYHSMPNLKASIEIANATVSFGQNLEFECSFKNVSTGSNLMIDYAIHFVKANGSRSPKVFKWKDMKSNALAHFTAKRSHSIKPITTRVYHPGRHLIEIIVNGLSVAEAEFTLVMDE